MRTGNHRWLCAAAFVLAANAAIAQTVTDLIALARRRPGELLLASAGTGSGTHLAAELFMSMAHIMLSIDGLRIVRGALA